MNQQYDIAAYIWPAYTGTEPRTRLFWPKGIGEWESVQTANAKFEGHPWPRKPLWGYADEADPAVMERQIEAAISHGVTVFIYDWYWFDRRPFLEQCLNDGFLKAKNNQSMRFYLMWANHDANYTWDKRNSDSFSDVIWRGDVDRTEFDRLTNRIIERYFSRSNYYTIEKAPVFMIYDIDNLVKGLGGVKKTRDALEDFRRRTVAAGHLGLHLQLVSWGNHSHNYSGVDGSHSVCTHELAEALGFDSVTNYQFAHLTNIDRDYGEVFADVKREWERCDIAYKIPYFPHVSIGWDNNPRFQGFRWGIMKNNTPEAFERALREAKAFVDAHPDRPPLVTVNSWNEWTESSYLEPDDLYGYGYLEAVKKVFLA